MNNKPLSVADFINLANSNVGEGLLRTGENNFELAKSFARQEAIEFYKWILHCDVVIGNLTPEAIYDYFFESKTMEKEK